jgi:hypothetical protein
MPRIFFALKYLTASARFEPANLGSKGQHATSRPPKSLFYNAPQLVGLLWTSNHLVAEISTWQHATLTTDRHIHATSGNLTHNLKRRAAADLRLRPRGHWDRHFGNVLLQNRKTLEFPVYAITLLTYSDQGQGLSFSAIGRSTCKLSFLHLSALDSYNDYVRTYCTTLFCVIQVFYFEVDKGIAKDTYNGQNVLCRVRMNIYVIYYVLHTYESYMNMG